MKTIIAVDNLKCGGCAGSIKNGLRSFLEVQEVVVDLDNEKVEVQHLDTLPIEIIKKKLQSMGYPEKGSTHGLNKLAAGAKSYISCAIGKISTEEEDVRL